ncbi:MAG TPA: MFS transporter [Candidatus Polarisedimenticolaceae bacterium]|nr:MFS transporter [Candidatus Polarisedimenticolaceae bacterium]
MSLAQRWQEVRTGFERSFWVANFTELFERLAYYGPQAVFAIYLHERLGLSSAQTTWLIGYYGFVVWFMPVLGGALADRFGFRRTLAGAFFMLAIGNFLLGSLSAPWMQGLREILPLFALMHVIMLIPAMGPAVVKPVVVGTTARAAKENVRSIGYSIYYTVVNIGAAIGPVFASKVRTTVGAEMVFLVSAALTAAMGVVTLLFYREPARRDEPQVASVGAALANLVKVLGNARFVVFLLIYSGFWVMFWQQYLSLAIYWRDHVDKDTNVDALLSWEALTVILTTLLATYLMRKVRPFTSIVLGVLISSLSFLLLTLGTSVSLVIAMLVVLAIGEVLQAPRYYEYVSRLAPPGQQGLFMGYAFLPIGIGFLGGGALAGRLLEHFGAPGRTPAHMWYVVTGVGVITTVLLFAYDRLLRPEEAGTS